MKKFIFILTLIFGYSLFLHSCYKGNNEVRIRIIAEDDSIYAQQQKLFIKEKALEILKSIEFTSYEKTTEILNIELHKIYFENNLKIEYVDEYFPAKSINNKVIPSGVYKTIKITIGSGKGSNWWSILYPEFFGVAYDETNNIEYKSYFYESLFG